MVNEGQSAPRAGRRTLADRTGVSALARTLRRRWPTMLLAALVCAAAAFGYQMTRPLAYTATALLSVTPRQAPQQINGQAVSAVDSEVELLRSSAMMEDLAQSIGLHMTSDDSAAQLATLAKSITVTRRGVTNVVEISAEARSGQRARQIANSYADVYLANQLRAHVDTSAQANSWLSRRLTQLRDDMEAKENAAEAFRVANTLPAPDAAPGAARPVVNTDMQAQVQLAQADLEEREARANRLQQLMTSGADIDALAGAVNSNALNALRDRLTDIEHRQADLENRYLPTHPDVIAIRNEKTQVQAAIDHEVQQAVSDLNAQVAAARSRVSSLQASARSSPAPAPAAAQNPDAVAHYRDLQREASVAREVYESYQSRNQDAADVTALNIPDTRILAYAALPLTPISPSLKLALQWAGLAAIIAALLAGLVTEMIDQSVKNSDDVEDKVGVKTIASIPTISRRMMRQMPPAERHPPGYLVGRPMSAFAEALRVLRTVIVYSKPDEPVKVVAVTSGLPNEGKTTISLCLARIAALSGQRVCVVDCDLRMQSISDVLDIETELGVMQVLAGQAQWRAAIVRDPNTEAHVLPVATSGFSPRDVFGSEAMGKLVNELRSQYDLVILDCPPILAVAETRILVQQADVTVLVAKSGKTPVGALKTAVAQTEGAGGRVLGVALNYVLPHLQTYSDSLYFNDSKSYYTVS